MNHSYKCVRCSKEFHDLCAVLSLESPLTGALLVEYDLCGRCSQSIDRWRRAHGDASPGPSASPTCHRCGRPNPDAPATLRLGTAGDEAPMLRLDLCNRCIESLGRWTARRGRTKGRRKRRHELAADVAPADPRELAISLSLRRDGAGPPEIGGRRRGSLFSWPNILAAFAVTILALAVLFYTAWTFGQFLQTLDLP